MAFLCVAVGPPELCGRGTAEAEFHGGASIIACDYAAESFCRARRMTGNVPSYFRCVGSSEPDGRIGRLVFGVRDYECRERDILVVPAGTERPTTKSYGASF